MAWAAIKWLSAILKSDLTNKIKRSFSKQQSSRYCYMEQYWTSPGGSTPYKTAASGHLPPITKTIKVRETRYVGHCWENKDLLISNILLWTPSHRRTKAGRSARIYKLQLCADTGCSLEDLPGAIYDRDGWRERVREIHASSATWFYLITSVYIYIMYLYL